MTALAASIGTGNIAGVATAVVAGGPGRGLLDLVLRLLRHRHQVHRGGSRHHLPALAPGDGVSSGPMYYLRDGLGLPWLASTYALVAGVAALTTTPFTQPNSIAVAFESEFSIAPWVSGVLIAVLTWLVIIGGVQSIGRAVEKLSPAEGLPVPGRRPVRDRRERRAVAGRAATIFSEAFSLRAATGSAAGLGLMVGMRYGLARGVYANEAGYGTAAVAYGTAQQRAAAAGAQRRHRGVHRLIRDLLDQRAHDPPDRRVDLRPQQHRRGRLRLRHRHPGRRRPDRRDLRLPVRVHDADRLGVLRGAVLRVHPGCRRHGTLPLDLLRPDRLRGQPRPGGDGVGVGRPDERAPGDIDPRSHPYISTGLREAKFGVDIARGPEILRRARGLPGVEVVGLQCHIGSQITDLEPLAAAARALAGLSRRLLDEGFTLRTIDVGGGLGVGYDGKGVPGPEALAAAILPAVEKLPLTLVLEPGRSLVAAAGVLLTRVLYVKGGHDRRFVVVDAGMNDLLRPALYDAFHRVEPVSPRGRAAELVDVVGPVCEASDFLARRRELERPEPGDLLAVRDAGAYGFAMSSSYNMRPRAAEALVEDGRARLVRRRETFEDLVRTEV
jgi:diaminopimelate decarboxylase